MGSLYKNKKILLGMMCAGLFCANGDSVKATSYVAPLDKARTFADGDSLTYTSSTLNYAIRDTTYPSTGVQVAEGGKITVDSTYTGTTQSYGIQLNNDTVNNFGIGSRINATATSSASTIWGISLGSTQNTGFTADRLELNTRSQLGSAIGLISNVNTTVNLGSDSHITTTSDASSSTGISQAYNTTFTANRLTVDTIGTTGASTGIKTNAGKTVIDLGSSSVINVSGKTATVETTGVNLYGQGDKFTATGLTINVDGTNGTNTNVYGIYSKGTAVGTTMIDLGTNSTIAVKSNNTGSNYISGIYALANTTLTADHLAITNTGKTSQTTGVAMAGANNSIDLGTGSSIALNGRGVGVSASVSNTNIFKASELTITGTEQAVRISSGGRAEITGGSHLEGILGGVLVQSGSTALVQDTEILLHPTGTGTVTGGLQASGTNSRIDAKNVTISSDTSALTTGLTGLNGGNIQSENTTVNILNGNGVNASGTNTLINLTGNTTINTLNGSGINASGTNTLVNLTGNTTISASPNGDAIWAYTNAQVTGTGKMDLTGDIYATNNGLVGLQMDAGSKFVGTADSTGGAINLAMTDSQWEMGALTTGSSYVNNLTLTNSTVNIGAGTDYQTLSIENLDGNGTFKMRTNFAAGESGATIGSGAIDVGGGDLLSITGTASGSHLLDVQNQGSANVSNTYNHLIVETANGGGDFALSHLVEVGPYLYDLRKDANGTGENWSLFQQIVPINPVDPVDPVGPVVPVLSSSAQSALNMVRASYFLNYGEMQTLSQRMGDLRQSPDSVGNVWAKMVFGKNEIGSTPQLTAFDQDLNGVQAGVDMSTTWAKGTFYKGLFVSYAEGNQSYSDGSGDIKSKSAGAYATYVASNGFYVDGVLKFNQLDQNFRAIDTAGGLVKGKSDTDGMAASLEVGKRIHLNKESKQGFYLEPQAQISWGYQNGDSFTATNGLNVDMDSYNSLIGRAGFMAGYEVKSGKNPINLYAKASYNHEFDGQYGANMNGAQINEDLGDSWWSYGVGITAQVGQKHNLYADLERASGGNFTQTWKVNLGYRFQW